jgi:hypothetical protein
VVFQIQSPSSEKSDEGALQMNIVIALWRNGIAGETTKRVQNNMANTEQITRSIAESRCMCFLKALNFYASAAEHTFGGATLAKHLQDVYRLEQTTKELIAAMEHLARLDGVDVAEQRSLAMKRYHHEGRFSGME